MARQSTPLDGYTHRRGRSGTGDDPFSTRTASLDELDDRISPVVGQLDSQSVAQPWGDDPRGYYTTFYTQFANIIMISTFTGGVQASVLSFMNDLLTADPLNVTLFKPDPIDPGQRIYSSYSLGVMLGLLAVALNFTVAAVAAVNAALACHFSLHVPTHHKPSMEARIVFCMIIQYIASVVGGISLVILSVKFNPTFAIVAAVLFFAGIKISAYHIVALFGTSWLAQLRGQPLHGISLVVSTAAFILDIATPSPSVPSPSSWFTITTYGITMVYHMLSVLHNTSSKALRPRHFAAWVFFVGILWAGCSVTTAMLKIHYRRSVVFTWVICGLAAVEAAVLVAIGVVEVVTMRRWLKQHDSASPKKAESV